jgi:hypothetical protein
MAQATKKKPQTGKNKAAAVIISDNPTRRSRAERAMVQLTTTSFPHYLIGNIVHAMSEGNEAQSKQALDVENKFGLLDFVRSLTISANETGMEFTVGWLTIDGVSTRIDSQLAQELTLANFAGDKAAQANLAKDTVLATRLVDVFHRSQVRGMTRVHDIKTGNWRLVEKRLTAGNGIGLAALGRSETVFDLSSTDAVNLVVDALSQEKFSLALSSETITIVHGDVTKVITYEVPPRA